MRFNEGNECNKEKGITVNEQYKILLINLSNGATKNDLVGNYNQKERMESILDVISWERPDVIALIEFAPSKCDDIVAGLQQQQYEVFYPEGYSRGRDTRVTDMVAVAIADNCVFKQQFCYDILEAHSYRYISGVLQKGGCPELFLIIPFIPPCKGNNLVAIRKKAYMLKSITDYYRCKKALYRYVAMFGNFNTVVHESDREDSVEFEKMRRSCKDTLEKALAQRTSYCFVNGQLHRELNVITEEIALSNEVSSNSYLRIHISNRT